jgi:hypothetical protein
MLRLTFHNKYCFIRIGHGLKQNQILFITCETHIMLATINSLIQLLSSFIYSCNFLIISLYMSFILLKFMYMSVFFTIIYLQNFNYNFNRKFVGHIFPLPHNLNFLNAKVKIKKFNSLLRSQNVTTWIYHNFVRKSVGTYNVSFLLLAT